MMQTHPDRLPLVIGVTGHRDLRREDVPRLEQEVAGIIDRLRRDYLDKDTPIVVLSALAEGADRLVARVALERGAQLIAPLPLPLADYRRDFEPGLEPGNAAEFDALLARAIVAPVMPVDAGAADLLAAAGRRRAEQYRAVGIFIARHCHVLLALWDGEGEDAAAGGTAEVVSFKRAGVPLAVSDSPRASLDASEIGPVIELVTPRSKAEGGVAHVAVRPWGREVVRRHRGGMAQRAWRRVAAFVGHVFHREHEDERGKLPAAERRDLESWENFEALIALNRQFNRDAAALAKRADGPRRLARGVDQLFADAEGGSIGNVDARAHATDIAPLWCRFYAVADALAQTRQNQFKWDWKLLFILGFIAFYCFTMFGHAGHVTGVFLATYVVTFVAIFILFAYAVRGRHQERYLDYRALAEALRVAVYWKLVGIGSRCADAKTQGGDGASTADADPIGTIADGYPIMQPSELAWVKNCLRTLEQLDTAKATPQRRIDPIGHAIARRFWVRGQLAYFRKQGFRHNGLAETIEAHSAILLVLSPFVFVPILIYLLHAGGDGHAQGLDIQHVIIIVVGLLPGVAAAWTGYSERLALKAQARQYDRMRMLFERAGNLLPRDIDDGDPLARPLYRELGMEAMRENAEWVAIYRQRPIQPLQ